MVIQKIAATIALVLLAGLHIVAGQCNPATVLNEFNSCLAGLYKATDLTKGEFRAAEVKTYCENSARSETRCAENVINRCKQSSSEVRRILDKAVNINAIKGSVKIICDANNTAALEAANTCLGRYQPTVSSCLVSETMAYNGEVQSISRRARSEGKEWAEEKLYDALCDYTGEVKQCQSPYGDNCGRKVQMVFDAMNHAVTPPVCSAVTDTVSLALLVAMAFMAVVKKF